MHCFQRWTVLLSQGGNEGEEAGMAERCESIKEKCLHLRETVSEKKVKVKSINGTSLK